jgi:hypothetical protein
MSPRFQRQGAPDDDVIAARIRAAAAAVTAPDGLRRRIEAQREAARTAPAARRLPRLGVAAVALACVAAIALALSLAGSGAGSPSLSDATAAALRAPTSTLTAADQHGATLGQPTIDGTAFPNYAYSAIDLRAVGARRDRAHGRDIVTVSYAGRDGARIGYAIVAAPAVGVPDGARMVTYRGTRFALLRAGGVNVVTWRRAGRTCVLASRTASHAWLLRVAAWDTRPQ